MSERGESKVSRIQNKELRKNEKGSIVLFVIIAMMFFLVIVFGIYINVKNKLNAQEIEINKIISSYSTIPDISDLYKDNVYINLYKEDGKVYSVEEWTNNDITVEAIYPEKVKSDSRLISLDGGKTFKVYSGKETIKENTTIIAKVKEDDSKRDEKIISRIDKILPTYTSTAKKQYIIPDTELSVNLDINITATDGEIEKSSGINTSVLSYSWGSSETEEPAKWTPITEYTQDGENITFNITKEKTIKGIYYLWLNIQDNAENNIEKRCITIDVIEPIAKIGSVIYGSLQSAINACATDGTETTIVMLRSVEERTITKEGQNIILQLDGKTVSNKSTDTPTIINYAKLTILDDNSESIGGITSSYIGIENKETGNLILGEDDDDVSNEKPKVSGKIMAITNNQGGTFGFYDGILSGGEKAIIGNINYTPVDYKTISMQTETSEMAYLGILADPLARIEDIYYGTLKSAISSSKKQETITILRGISTEESIEVPEDKDVKLDLNGYIITTATSDYALKNFGTLELEDLVGTGSFTSTTSNTIYNGQTGNLKVNGATVNINKYGESSAIYNDKGNVEVLYGAVTASNNDNRAIHNHAGTVNVNGGEVKAIGSNTKGIYNESVTEGRETSQETSQIEIGDLTENGTYYFVKEGDALVSNNVGVDSSVANSYLKIDLTKYTEDRIIDIIVNAQISSEGGYDFGYATITKDTTTPSYGNANIMCISGTVDSKDYPTSIKGGDIYYLHFGYRKDGSASSGSDKFTINSIGIGIFDDVTTMGNVNVNGGIVSSESYSTSIYNGINGTININGGTVKSRGNSGYYAIHNNSNGVINLKGGTINTYQYGIYNYSTGSVNVTGGKITNYNDDISNSNGIYNNDTGVVKVENGEMGAIYQNGTGEMAITGGNIGTISNNNTQTIEVKDATIKSIQNSKNGGFKVNNCTIDNTDGVYNAKGTIEINNSIIENTINNTTIYGVRNYDGTITINNSEINVNSTIYAYGIYNYQNGTINLNNSSINVANNSTSYYAYGIYNNQNGNINVIKSNIIATKNTDSSKSNTYGIYNKESGTVTLGNKNDNSDIDEITITGTTAGVFNNNGVLNFYDGTITGTKSIEGYVSDIEENYNIEISKTDEIEKAILTNEQYDVVEIVETGIKYHSLQEAIKACSNDAGENISTIRVLKTPLYVSNTETNIEDGQNIKLDINGKDICFGQEIINNGIFLIDDTSDTKGKITLKSIINNNSLSINNGNIYLKTSSTGIYNARNCSLKITGGTVSLETSGTDSNNYIQAILNEGQLEIGEGAIITTNKNNYCNAILNKGGTTRVTGGTISANNSNSNGIKNINSFNGIEANGEYYFEEKDGKLKSNNDSAGVYGNSYVKMDLTGKEGTYKVRINTTGNRNAQWSGSDIQCYATITENTTAPTADETEGRFMYYQDVYTEEYHETTIEGGKVYYLHFGIKWNGNGNKDNSNMVVNSIQVYNESEELDIQNTGKVYIAGGKIQTEGQAILIDNAGYLEMTTGDLIGGNGTAINNKELGKVVINGGNITGNNIGINTSGKNTETEINDINMNISATTTEKTVYGIQVNGGKIQINGGTITVDGSTWNSYANGIFNNGYYNTEIRMTGGEINATGCNEANGIWNNGNDTNIEIIEGKIETIATRYNGYGIYNYNGNITLGTKDKNVSTETPSISGTTNGIYKSSGNLYFYDGIIKGKTAYLQGDITEKEEGYEIYESTEGEYQTAILKQVYVAEIEETGEQYYTLKEAIENSKTNGETTNIKILNNITLQTEETISNTNNIILNVNEKTIKCASTASIINKGNLKLTGGTISLEGSGADSNNYIQAILNEGQLEIGGGATITTNKNDYCNAILNKGGTTRVTGGTIIANSSYSNGIKNINTFNGVEANGEYYFEEKDGKLIGNNSGVSRTYANSYVKIDLTGKEGTYKVRINTTGNNGSPAWTSIICYATITENETAPTADETEGRFMYYTSAHTDEYNETTIEGGKVYYLHLGFIWYGDNCYQNMMVNSIQVYNDNEELNIQNKGEVYIEGGTIQTEGSGTLIDNAGYIEMTTGDLVGGDGTALNNKEVGKVVINGGNITGNNIGINTSGKNTETEINDINMNISATTTEKTVYGIQVNGGKIQINGGTITVDGSTWNSYANGIFNNGYYNTEIRMTGGEINATGCNEANGIWNNGNDTNIEIIEGKIETIATRYNGYGIYNYNGNITLGTKDKNVSTETPSISGTTNGIYKSSGNLYFYDGIIKGKTAYLQGDITEKEEGYEIYESTEGEYQTAILKQVYVAEIEETGEQYYTLKEAIENSKTNGETTNIKILNNITLQTEETISNTNNIILNVNEKTIKCASTASIINKGNLKLTGGTISLEGSGADSNNYIQAILNEGQLEIGEGATITTNKNDYCNAILNKGGTTRVTGGTIETGGTTSVYEYYTKGIKNINSFNGIEANGEYYFEEKDGKLVSNNDSAGEYGNSYVKIDLTGKEGTYKVRINTTGNRNNQWSGSYIQCYATITENTTAPTVDETEGRFMYYQDVYTEEYNETTIEGGKVYYLHFGIKWTGNGNKDNSNMVVNSIQVYNESEELDIQNTGKLYIEGGTIQTEGYAALIDNTGYLEMTTGDLIGGNGIAIDNKRLGKVVLNGGNITGNNIGIKTSGKNTEIEINNINMNISAISTVVYGINQNEGKIQINGGTIIIDGTKSTDGFGIYTGYNAEIKITGGEIKVTEIERAMGIWCNGSNTNIEIVGGKIEANTTGGYTAYGINNYNGNITLGTKDKNVSTENPSISGTTNGIYNENGNLFFYDGVVIGQVSIYGQITSVEPHYGINISTDSDSNQHSALVLIPTDNATAFVNGNYYNDVQSAIDACGTDKKYYVVMMNGANISSSLNIDSTKDIVLDLGGFTITSETDYTIINNGTLTIIDSDDSTGLIKNTVGTVIKNNGTLTIGKDDRIVSETAPCIEANIYGVENGSSNETNFYDGIIKAVQDCIYSGTISVPNGYKTVEEAVDGINITTLKVDE